MRWSTCGGGGEALLHKLNINHIRETLAIIKKKVQSEHYSTSFAMKLRNWLLAFSCIQRGGKRDLEMFLERCIDRACTRGRSSHSRILRQDLGWISTGLRKMRFLGRQSVSRKIFGRASSGGGASAGRPDLHFPKSSRKGSQPRVARSRSAP